MTKVIQVAPGLWIVEVESTDPMTLAHTTAGATTIEVDGNESEQYAALQFQGLHRVQHDATRRQRLVMTTEQLADLGLALMPLCTAEWVGS